jgi:glycosyltransferase involved in cell wall biosynthesis
MNGTSSTPPRWQFSMRQPLTVIVPVKNERMNIAPCIASFHAIADEIIVADSGSVDDTIDIAMQFDKVRCIEREYITSGDFKNWAIPQATNEWVLIVDADERVTSELASEIELELSRGTVNDGYWIRRENHFLGHRMYFGDARTDRVLRLFRRDRGRYIGPSDHGEVSVQGGKTGQLKSPFMHYTCWSYDQLFLKHHRYTTLQAEQWYEQRMDTSYFKLLVRPAFRFFRELILQGGILDGKVGLQQAWLAAFYSFSKQARLWELNNGLPQPPADEQPSPKLRAPREIRRAA